MVERDPGDRFAAQLSRWASEMAADDAAGSRTRQRWLRQQASEAATLTGVLVDLAEAGTSVTVTTRAEQCTGTLVGVGRDFCVLSTRAPVVVALRAIVAVGPAGPVPDRVDGRVGGRARGADGGRAAPLEMALVDVLELFAADRAPVRLTLDGGSAVTGPLVSVGDGTVGVLIDGEPRRLLTVVIDAIATCLVR